MAQLQAPEFSREPPTTTEMKKAHVSQPEDRHVPKPARNLPFLMDGDFLQVINDEARTLDFRWARKHYTIEPGGMMIVPFEALVNALGDPRSMDNQLVKFNDGEGGRGIIMDRYAELSRLFALYSVENENIDELVAKAPKVSTKTLTGQTVRFPSQMPDMLPWPAPLVDEFHVNADTTKMIDAVAAENSELRDMIARLEGRLDEEVSRRQGVEEMAE